MIFPVDGEAHAHARFATLVEWRQGAFRIRQVADYESMTVWSMQWGEGSDRVVLLSLRRLEDGHWETAAEQGCCTPRSTQAAGVTPSPAYPRESDWIRVRHEETLARLEAGYRRFVCKRLDAVEAASAADVVQAG